MSCLIIFLGGITTSYNISALYRMTTNHFYLLPETYLKCRPLPHSTLEFEVDGLPIEKTSLVDLGVLHNSIGEIIVVFVVSV